MRYSSALRGSTHSIPRYLFRMLWAALHGDCWTGYNERLSMRAGRPRGRCIGIPNAGPQSPPPEQDVYSKPR